MTTAAVIFDMDGVLVDSASLHVRAYEQVFSDAGIGFSDAARTAVRQGKPRSAVIDMAAPGATDAVRRALFEAKPAAVMRAIRGRDVGMPGALSTIRELRAHAVPVGVVTNSATPWPWLESAGMRSYVTVVVGRDEVSQPKPSSEGYLLAAKRLDVEPAACLVIEDSPDGWLAATRAGMRVCVLCDQRPGWVDRDTELLHSLDPVTVLSVYRSEQPGRSR